jgi:hypothetical protein
LHGLGCPNQVGKPEFASTKSVADLPDGLGQRIQGYDRVYLFLNYFTGPAGGTFSIVFYDGSFQVFPILLPQGLPFQQPKDYQELACFHATFSTNQLSVALAHDYSNIALVGISSRKAASS